MEKKVRAVFILTMVCFMGAMTMAAEKQRRLSLTIADMVDTLADYTIVYNSSSEFCDLYSGLTEPYAKRITICGTMDLGFRRATIIHEMLHAASWRHTVIMKDQYTEEEIRPAVERIYAEMYK